MATINQRFFRSNVTGVINLPLNGNTTLTLESNISALTPTDTKSYRIVFRADSPSGNIVARSNVITMYGNAFLSIQATGGTRTEEGNWIVHAFTSSDNFNISSLSLFPQRNTLQYLAVAGGGSPNPSTYSVAGGGAGGLLQGNISVTPDYISNTSVIVGAGGAGGSYGIPGQNTSVFTSTPRQITAIGGGGGNQGGGSGGGAQVYSTGSSPQSGRAGTPGQGNPGGNGSGVYTLNPSPYWTRTTYSAGGGGGAGGKGGDIPGVDISNERGGNGLAVPWVPSSYGVAGPTPGRWFAAGAGGQGYRQSSPGAPGGGGTSTESRPPGAGFGPNNGSASQPGVVIIRYPKG